MWATKHTEVLYPELLSLTISKMKIKTTLKYGLTTIWKVKLTSSITKTVNKCWGKGRERTILIVCFWDFKVMSFLKSVWRIVKSTKINLSQWLSYTTPWHMPKECKTPLHIYLLSRGDWCSFHNSYEKETVKIYFTW